MSFIFYLVIDAAKLAISVVNWANKYFLYFCKLFFENRND